MSIPIAVVVFSFVALAAAACGDDDGGEGLGGGGSAASSAAGPTGSTPTSVAASSAISTGAPGATSSTGVTTGGGGDDGCELAEPGDAGEGDADWVVAYRQAFDDGRGQLLAVNLLDAAALPVHLATSASLGASLDSWTSDGERFAAKVDDVIQIWSMRTADPELERTIPVDGYVIGWDPSGVWLAIEVDGAFTLFDTTTDEAIEAFDIAGASVVWSPGGRWVLLRTVIIGAPYQVVDLEAHAVVTIDEACHYVGSEAFLGDQGILCTDEEGFALRVPLGDGASGQATRIEPGGSPAKSFEVASAGDGRIVYAGVGPEGLGVYAATPTTDGLIGEQLLFAGGMHGVRKVADRVYIEDYADATLRGVQLGAGDLPAPLDLGVGFILGASSLGGWLALGPTTLLDATDLADPVSHELETETYLVTFAPEVEWGVIDLFNSSADEWSHVHGDASGVVETSLGEDVLFPYGETATHARTATRLFDGPMVWEANGGPATPRPDLPCGATPVAPQAPVMRF